MQRSPSEWLDFDRKFITAGWRGNIFRYGDFCLKKAINPTFVPNIQREILILTKINSLAIASIPCVYASGENWLVMDWIEGISFDKRREITSKGSKQEVDKKVLSMFNKNREILSYIRMTEERGTESSVILSEAKNLSGDRSDIAYNLKYFLGQQLLDIGYALDKVELFHGELHRPMSNVLVDGYNKVWLIDFDQGGFGNTQSKNLRQLAQWMLFVDMLKLEEMKGLGLLSRDALYDYLSSVMKKLA